jgi:hypothetical protein
MALFLERLQVESVPGLSNLVNVGRSLARAHLSHPHIHRTYKTHLLGLLQIPANLLLAS